MAYITLGDLSDSTIKTAPEQAAALVTQAQDLRTKAAIEVQSPDTLDQGNKDIAMAVLLEQQAQALLAPQGMSKNTKIGLGVALLATAAGVAWWVKNR